jgi:hypothetical protein
MTFNLRKASKQAIFDHVATHLCLQGEPAVDDAGACVYLNTNYLRCAAGWCLTDAQLSSLKPDKLYQIWGVLCKDGLVSRNHQNLISELQTAHDSSSTCQNWQFSFIENMKVVAERFSLKRDILYFFEKD